MPSLKHWLPLALVLAAALWLRTSDLAARPMHSDEANQAVKFGELLETGHYAFDPRDHHGPTLYYAALPIAWLRGQHTLASLDEVTVRLVPALAGTAAVVLLYFLALPLGVWPALMAAAILAVSPPAVYYSRYFVQETLLLSFALAAFVSARQWWTTQKIGWSIALGVSVGLMQATKASAPFFLLAAALALFVCRRSSARGNRLTPRNISLILFSALLTAALFYSSFGTNLRGLSDAIATYQLTGARIGGGLTGHEKPWWYYLQLFTWHREGGLLFEQSSLTFFAVVGVIAACVSQLPLLRWAAVYTLLVLLFLSFPAYKTPWHAIHLVPGLALLVAGAHQRFFLIGGTPTSFRVSVALALVTLGALVHQTNLTSFLRPADPRNPYAYVHSSADVKKYRALADAAHARYPNRVIRVISEEYWPLPWYFRGLDVGYWPGPPMICDGALVIASEHQAAAVRSLLRGAYDESILGLRPGFIMVVFTPKP